MSASDGTAGAGRNGPATVRALAVVLGLAAALLALGRPAAAQEGGPFPEWARGWSPLAPLAEIPRELPGVSPAPDLALAPARRVGEFWTVGNPAALPWEATESWTAIGLGRQSESGDYRRPLDPQDRDVDRIQALSWTPLGDWGAAAGELETGRDLRGPSSFADFFEPHRGTPFVLTDTGSFDMRNVFARLEGALGLKLGEWGLGVAAGYEANEDRTRESPFVRLGEQTEFAGTVGVLRRVDDGRLQVGAHVRGRGGTESWSLIPAEQAGVAHQLRGLTEPERLPITNSPLFRRVESSGVAGGISLGGTAGGLRWLVYGELGRGKEQQTGTRQAEPDDPMDRWERDVIRFGGALRWPLSGRLVVTADGEWMSLDGEATVADIQEPVVVVDQSRISASGQLRLLPGRKGWSAAFRGGIRSVRWDQVDRFVELSSELDLTRPEFAVAVANRASPKVTLAGSYGIAFHGASGRVPDTGDQGEAYRRLIAPELALYGTAATAQAVSGTLRWQVSSGTGLWFQGRFETVSPDGRSQVADVDPRGERDAFGVTLGVVLGTAGPGSVSGDRTSDVRDTATALLSGVPRSQTPSPFR